MGWFVPICAILCRSPVFLRAARLLTPFVCWLKKIVEKGAAGFKAPFPPKKNCFWFLPEEPVR
jgi:hypothetical protein